MSKSKQYATKTLYDVILVLYWPENAQILESDFSKSQNWETSSCFTKSKFQQLFVSNFDSNSIWMYKKSLFLQNLLQIKSKKLSQKNLQMELIYLVRTISNLQNTFEYIKKKLQNIHTNCKTSILEVTPISWSFIIILTKILFENYNFINATPNCGKINF